MNNTRKLLTLMIVLAILSPTVISTASAYTELKIMNNNLNTLNSFTNSGAWYNVGSNSYLLKWYGGGQYFEPGFKAPAYYKGIITATTMADYKGYYWGECVSMAKNLAHSTVQTKDWYRGRNVVTSGNIPQGTVIATFSKSDGTRMIYDNNKPDHTAIFRQYIYANGKISGIMVWDQNVVPYYPSKLVGMHIIQTSGSGYNGANNYYVVNI